MTPEDRKQYNKTYYQQNKESALKKRVPVFLALVVVE